MSNQRKNLLFVACTYTFFWVVVILAVLLPGTPQSKGTVSQFMLLVGGWAPTIAVFVLFKRLFPGNTIKRFYQNAFRGRLNTRLLLVITAVQALIVICTVGMIAFTKRVSVVSLFNLSIQSIATCILITLVTGATGEESGWRGFLQISFEKRFTVIRSSIITGIIWAIWHAPLWFTTSGFEGMELLRYIVSFVITIVSLAVVIGICYDRCRNLFVPMWIHFMFNLVAPAFTGSMLDFMTWYAVFYGTIAVGYGMWYSRT
ncbi:CPBP family intramembrane glutamic endopeptidase [Hungatella hathewayi]|uniref:CPBP family intramembrane glutamic endopeptidase n=1 Tax=Hungatella hathewayi TaxID=154046 RepID=UPI0035694184